MANETETLLKSIREWIDNYNNEPKYDDIKTCIDLRDNAYELFLKIGNNLEKEKEKIATPIYYAEIDGEKVVDEDSVREEFEFGLKEAGLRFRFEAIKKRIEETTDKAEMNDLEIEKQKIIDETEDLFGSQ